MKARLWCVAVPTVVALLGACLDVTSSTPWRYSADAEDAEMSDAAVETDTDDGRGADVSTTVMTFDAGPEAADGDD